MDEILTVLSEVRGGGILSVPPTRLGLFGHSRGAGEAVVAARDDQRLNALVTWAGLGGFDRWSEEVKEEWRSEGQIYVMNARTGQQMPLNLSLLEDFESHRERLDIEAAASALRDLPWLIVHGETDMSVPVSDARRLASANSDASVELIPGAGHTFEAVHPFQGSTPELDQAIRVTAAHFRRYLLP